MIAGIIGKEEELSTPLLTDLDHIPMLRHWYCELIGSGKPRSRKEASRRSEFVCLVLLLYSPVTLAGGKMGNGVRKALADLFQYKSSTSITNISDNIESNYDRYKDYEENVDYCLNEFLIRLKDRGLI